MGLQMEISFILVEPAIPENIGASARAIKTMGFKNLRLVNPFTNHFDKKARVLAHASTDILDDAKVYSTFQDAISGLDFLVATSAKRRRTNEDYLQADDLPGFLMGRKESINNAGIIFGGEESGLSNSVIKNCDLITYVPLANPYPSLNLSQAVMIYAFLLSDVLKPSRTKEESGKYPMESLQVLKSKVKDLLEKIEIKQSHIIGPRIMERMTFLKKEDINLLHSIYNSVNKKLFND
jgi:tRNA/rRNA methyltransferase